MKETSTIECVILDVRTKEEINNGYLLNASFIDYYDPKFLEKASWINKNLPVFVYCHAGGRSSKAAQQLIGLGFEKVYNLKGGYSQWKESDFPVEQGAGELHQSYPLCQIQELESMLDSSDNALLVFKTPWCIPCKKLDTVIERVINSHKEWDIVIINMDQNPKAAEYFNVKSVPTILAYHKQELFYTHIGFIDYIDLISSLLQ